MSDHYIYVMSRPDGAHKIGCSRTPRVRAQQLKAELVYQRTVERDAFRVEKEAHKLLKDKRIPSTEWFDVSFERAAAAVDCVAGK